MNRYRYKGPVYDLFDNILEYNWKAETIAPNIKKAKSNLMFRYKQEHNMPKTFKISFESKMEEHVYNPTTHLWSWK